MRKCKVINCDRKYLCKGYCRRHYMQKHLYGKILKRTIFDKNTIKIKKNFAEIELYDKQKQKVAKTKIDLEDIDKCKQYKWHLRSDGYVGSKIGLLSKFLLNEHKKIVDHINHDILDNQKQNLRRCSYQQNLFNRKNVNGVYWCKDKNKWKASLKLNYKNIHLGYFINKQKAIQIRKQAEIKYFGEFRYV